jgi:hypothetical protein
MSTRWLVVLAKPPYWPACTVKPRSSDLVSTV